MNLSAFLQKYNIDNNEFISTGYKWGDLCKIMEDYEKSISSLNTASNFIYETLRKAKSIHSLKVRIKNAESLIAKVIRKKIDKNITITLENYQEMILDLIGVRALHLYKEDWPLIHDFIMDTWEVIERPCANVREGDSKKILKIFKEKGCDVKPHPFGYRSVHYTVEFQPEKKKCFAEIQVRTIFEEGWSEIDHKVRYLYNLNNPILNQFLVLFNRLAGQADEMGSYVRFLNDEINKMSEDTQKSILEKDNLISKLTSQIEKLKMDATHKKDLLKDIEKLSDLSTTFVSQEINAGKIGALSRHHELIPSLHYKTLKMNNKR